MIIHIARREAKRVFLVVRLAILNLNVEVPNILAKIKIISNISLSMDMPVPLIDQSEHH